MSGINITKVSFDGFDDCIKLDNGLVSLIVTTKVGPRILYYGCSGYENMLHVFPDDAGKADDGQWRLFGGHRLWAGPQVRFRPNEPEDKPVSYMINKDGVTLTNEIQTESRIQKKLQIRMDEGSTHVHITHTITSWCVWPIQLTVWPVTVFPADGLVFWSNAAPDTFYLPNDVKVFWPWSIHGDPRFTETPRYSCLRPAADDARWFKVGVPNHSGYGVYCGKNQMFVKKYKYMNDKVYSDFGSSLEVFCDNVFTELESVSPLYTLASGESAVHEEDWYAFPEVARPETEDDMDKLVRAYVDPLME